jgi:hypothetical protein
LGRDRARLDVMRTRSGERSRGASECYADNKMIDAMIAQIRGLDVDREYRALTTHVTVTNPVGLELLAYEQLNSPKAEARRIAAIQLRVVHDFASKLRWLEGMCLDPDIDPGVRVGLVAILRNLTNESDLLPVIDSEAAVLLEPALLFHALLSRLRPWLPPMAIAFEPASVLELLQLGIPDYLHPLLRQRFETLWQQFHQLRQLPLARLSVLSDPPRIDADRIGRLLEDPQLKARTYPPVPAWGTVSRKRPWLDDTQARPRTREWYRSDELTG